MKSPNVTYFSQSDLKYTKNDLKFGKNDLKYYDLKWDFPLGGLQTVFQQIRERMEAILKGIVSGIGRN